MHQPERDPVLPGTATGGTAWDVFLAYAAPDRIWARSLFEALADLGVRVCFDQDVLQPGDDWHLLLPRLIRASSIVVVLVSPHTDRAHYERSEVVTAVEIVRREGRRLVPVRLDPGVGLPYGTEQLQAVDMFQDADVAPVARRVAALLHVSQPAAENRSKRVFSDRVPAVPRFFTGRDDLLSHVWESLREGQATVVSQAIQGLGGVGKTTLAAAFADHYRDDYDVVWWIRAEDPAVLVTDLAELAPHVGTPLLDDPLQTAGLVRRQLEATARSWLLVFDNVPDRQAVEEWIPRRGRGSVLLTSRHASFPFADHVVPLDTFPPDVAADFLRHRVGQHNPAAAAADLGPVVERLGGLPLALEQAGAWVAQIPNRRFDRFVQLYDDAARDPFPDGTRPSGYDHTATTTWRLSLAAAKADARHADRVMAVLSFFAPDSLPCQWLRDMGDADYFDHVGPDAISDALDALHIYSLAAIAPEDTISVHRVVQAVTRRSAPAEAARVAICTLRRNCPDDPFSYYSSWHPHAVVAPHALAAADSAAIALPEGAHDLCSMLNDVAEYQYNIGALRDALTTATRSHRLATTHLGHHHPDTLVSRQRMVGAGHITGEIHRAIADYEALSTDFDRELGDAHPLTLQLRNSLAHAYQSAGALHRAIALYEANLADRQRVLGDDHVQTLESRNNLAHAYRTAGDLGRAIPLQEAVLADFARALGRDHPRTLISRNNLAGAYRAAGDLDRAISLFETTLTDRQRVLGEHHPQTLTTRNDLARAFQAAGELDRAISLFETTLTDRQRVLGDDHPQTLISRNRLAGAYRAAGDLDRAIPLFETTLADRQRILGEDHPATNDTYVQLERARSEASDAAQGERPHFRG